MEQEQKVKSTFDVACLKVIHSTGVDGRKIAMEKNSSKDEGCSDWKKTLMMEGGGGGSNAIQVYIILFFLC